MTAALEEAAGQLATPCDVTAPVTELPDAGLTVLVPPSPEALLLHYRPSSRRALTALAYSAQLQLEWCTQCIGSTLGDCVPISSLPQAFPDPIVAPDAGGWLRMSPVDPSGARYVPVWLY